jgi:SAM-dependent methyltransferase
MTTPAEFYDRMTPFYHLIFADWEASIQRQATQLDGLIRQKWGADITTILDVACGIGTQSLGLARLGYHVTASDLSPTEIERARQEAAARQLQINFSIADMRQAHDHHRQQFDLVIACDNAIPHLLTDTEILQAFHQFYACTRPGGGCLITVRDYDQEARSGTQVKPYGLHQEGDTRYLIFQVWQFQNPPLYELAMYFIEDQGHPTALTHIMRTRYYAVSVTRLIELMTEAGFTKVERVDGAFYQPVIVGKKETKAKAVGLKEPSPPG